MNHHLFFDMSPPNKHYVTCHVPKQLPPDHPPAEGWLGRSTKGGDSICDPSNQGEGGTHRGLEDGPEADPQHTDKEGEEEDGNQEIHGAACCRGEGRGRDKTRTRPAITL